MKKSDFHIHTFYCGHAKGTVGECVRAAIQLGMDEICFTEHLYPYFRPENGPGNTGLWCTPEENVEPYVKDVLAAQKDYPDLKIRLGIEADFIPGSEKKLEQILLQYPFEYVIGSVHCVPSLSWDHLTHCLHIEPLALYREYFKTLKQAAASGLFCSMAHPDFVWRYIPWPEAQNEEMLKLAEEYLLEIKKNKNLSVEANANSVIWASVKSPAAFDPFESFYQIAAKHKIPVTLGSDAHRPLQIASGFGELIERLLALGIKQSAVFENRKMKMQNLR